jgi:hypothetical protein
MKEATQAIEGGPTDDDGFTGSRIDRLATADNCRVGGTSESISGPQPILSKVIRLVRTSMLVSPTALEFSSFLDKCDAKEQPRLEACSLCPTHRLHGFRLSLITRDPRSTTPASIPMSIVHP